MPRAKKEDTTVAKKAPKEKKTAKKVTVKVDENDFSDAFELLKFKIQDVVQNGESITKEELLREIDCYEYTEDDFDKLLTFLKENNIE